MPKHERSPGTATPGLARRLWDDHGLSMVLAALFVISLIGQTVTGWRVHNESQRQHGEQSVSLSSVPAFRAFRGGPHSRTGRASFSRWPSMSC